MSKAEGKAKGKPGAQEKAAAKLREERAITERLVREGLARKDVPKDGACLFRAIAEHIYQSQAHHILVRDECLDFVQTHRDDFEPFICADGVQFDHYIAEMRKPNSWGGQVELQAASIRYSVNFDIITSQPNHTVVDNGFKRTIQLCFSHGNHYDTVYPVRRFEAERLCQGVVYELLDRMLGLTLPVGGYDYRNVQMDVWRRGIEEQKQADADRAKKLQEEAQNLSGFYKKDAGDEGEMTPSRRRRNKKKANKQAIIIPLSVADPLKKKRADEGLEDGEEDEVVEVEPKIDISAEEAFPTLPPTKPKPAVSAAPSSPAAAPAAAVATAQSPSAGGAAAPATPTSGGSKWGQQRNWNTVFTPPPAAPAAKAAPSPAQPAPAAAAAAPAATVPTTPTPAPVAATAPAPAPATTTAPSAPAPTSPSRAAPSTPSATAQATPTRSPKTSQQGVPTVAAAASPAQLSRSKEGVAPPNGHAKQPPRSPKTSQQGVPTGAALDRSKDGAASASASSPASGKKASRENVPPPSAVAAAAPATTKGGEANKPKVVWGVPQPASKTADNFVFGDFGPAPAATAAAARTPSPAPSAAAAPAANGAPSKPQHSPAVTAHPASPSAPSATAAAPSPAPSAQTPPSPSSPLKFSSASVPHPGATMSPPPPHAWAMPPHALPHGYFYAQPQYAHHAPPPYGVPAPYYVGVPPPHMYTMPPHPYHPMSPPHQ